MVWRHAGNEYRSGTQRRAGLAPRLQPPRRHLSQRPLLCPGHCRPGTAAGWPGRSGISSAMPISPYCARETTGGTRAVPRAFVGEGAPVGVPAAAVDEAATVNVGLELAGVAQAPSANETMTSRAPALIAANVRALRNRSVPIGGRASHRRVDRQPFGATRAACQHRKTVVTATPYRHPGLVPLYRSAPGLVVGSWGRTPRRRVRPAGRCW